MKTYKQGFQVVCVAIIAALLLSALAFAQEGGFTDDFEDGDLSNYDQSPEAVVSNGVLAIGPGNLAIRMVNISNFKAQFKVKFAGNGLVMFRFNMRDGSDYATLFFNERVVVERVTDGQPAELGTLEEWSGFSGDWDTVTVESSNGKISVGVNGEALVDGQDSEEPLRGGPMGFFVEGESGAEFDDFKVEVLAPPEGEAAPPAESAPAEAAAPTAQPTEESGIAALLSKLSESRGSPLDITTAAINLLLSVVFAYILSRLYIHWGSALSNRRRFAANFILITVTTTFIILTVRSSVALSLGLVGALSIVRFRAAIKEPEELAYLFLAIGIGIGLGDNQRLITVLALAIVILVIGISRIFRGKSADFNLHLTVSSGDPKNVPLESITQTLKDHAAQSRLMRLDENKKAIEASYLVEFRNNAQFEAAKNALQALSDEIEITFLDNKGIG